MTRRRTQPPRPPAGPPATADVGAARIRALLMQTFDRKGDADAGKPVSGRVSDSGWTA